MMDDIDRSFAWWTAALKGERGPIDADNPRAGFYRAKSKEKSLSAVAIWYDSNSGELRYQDNGRDVDDMKARERWPYVSRRPISEETFWHFRDTGKWNDVDSAVQEPDEPSEAAPNVAMAAKITALKGSADKYAKIESDEAMVLAQSVRAELMEQSGKADKARVEEKAPHLEKSREVDAKWQSMIKIADAAALAVRRSLEAWNDFKLEQAAAAQKATRAAQTDMGEPPVITSNAPAPSTQIRGGGGRAASVSVKPRVTAIDLDKAWLQFRLEGEVSDVFFQLAQRTIDAGLPCEAATVENKSSVR